MKKKINYNKLIAKRRKEKLNNVLCKVEELAKKHGGMCAETIFYIVKIYADNINYQNNVNILCGSEAFDITNDTYLIRNSCPVSDVDVILPLGKVPVVTRIRDRERQLEALEQIGNKNNPWKEDKKNHWYNLYLPLGLVVATENGNHSVNCGIVKSVGMINISSDERRYTTNIYDNSAIYDSVYFDGKYYRDIKTNEILEKTKFECGCLFEIGRIINKYDISFLGIFNEYTHLLSL